jgi:DNA-binding transcriptional MerR regulator
MNAQSLPAPHTAELESSTAPVGPLTGKPVAAKASSQKSATAFRTISEVADQLSVQQHVLRFWETKFSQIRPLKRGGGRRYYRPEDVDLLKSIHRLLYSEGYTIKGVQKLLREKGKNLVVEKSQPAVQVPGNANASPAVKAGLSERQRLALQAIAGDLRDLRELLVTEA